MHMKDWHMNIKIGIEKGQPSAGYGQCVHNLFDKRFLQQLFQTERFQRIFGSFAIDGIWFNFFLSFFTLHFSVRIRNEFLKNGQVQKQDSKDFFEFKIPSS
jgi:hypothetical protein